MKFRTFRILSAGVVVAIGGAAAFIATRHKEPTYTPQPAPAPATPPPPAPPPTPTPTPTATPTRAPTPPPTPAPTPPPSSDPDALRPLDRAILSRLATPLSGDKVTDAFPGQPYKVNLYKDAGHDSVNRLKIDLDRDGKWDEKWTLEPDGRIKRQVAPADDERYTASYTTTPGSPTWKRKEVP